MTSPTPIQTQPRSRLTKRQGISIVIAMLMVMAFMLTMADLMQAMNRSKIITESGWNADQARANAELGLSLGILSQTKPDVYQKRITGNWGYDTVNEQKTPVTVTIKDQSDGSKIMTFNNGPLKGNTVQWKVVDVIGGDKAGQACNKVEPKDAAQTKDDCSSSYYFVYPFPGSGTVGGGRCDAAKTGTVKNEQWYKDMYFYALGKEYSGDNIINEIKTSNDTKIQAIANLTALDHPCMWNTLGKGVSAEIPLYRKTPNADGKTVDTFGMDQIKNFWLRVRLPCKEGTVCENTKRYKIQAKDQELQIATNDKKMNSYYNLLHWNIQSKCKVKDENNNAKDNLCYISDVNVNAFSNPTEGEGKDFADAISPEQLTNMQKQIYANDSAITYQRLANAGDKSKSVFDADIVDTVLSFFTKNSNEMYKPLYIRDGNSEINYGKFTDFFKKEKPWGFIKEITNPLFRLSIASLLITTDKNVTADHIEYQLLYKRKDTGTTPIITNPVVTATGSSNGYDITLEKSVLKQGGAYNYPIIGK